MRKKTTEHALCYIYLLWYVCCCSGFQESFTQFRDGDMFFDQGKYIYEYWMHAYVYIGICITVERKQKQSITCNPSLYLNNLLIKPVWGVISYMQCTNKHICLYFELYILLAYTQEALSGDDSWLLENYIVASVQLSRCNSFYV